MYSEEMIRQRFQEICDDFEGDLKYPEEFFDAAIREIVSEEYRDLPVEELEALVINELAGMPPMIIEGFFSSLKKFGKKLWKKGKKVLKKALPIVQQAAPLLSFIPGVGPAIAPAVGGAAGILGSLLGGKGIVPGAKPGQRLPGALGQLGALINNPNMLQALTAQMLPNIGRKSIPVGKNKTQVPVGAFMNLLGSLTNKAAAEMNALGTGTQETPNYLLNQEGELLCDPAVPEERAQVLWKLLEEADSEEQAMYRYPGFGHEWVEPEEFYLEDELEDIDDDDEELDDEMDPVEAYYEEDDDDEMELADAYGEEDDDDEMEYDDAYAEEDDDDEMEG